MSDVEKTSSDTNQILPLLPLKDIVVFPHMIVPVFVNEDLCMNAIENALANNRKIFLSAFKVQGWDGEGLQADLEPPFDVYNIGTICTIMRTRKLPDGRMKVLVQGICKASVIELKQSADFPIVAVKPFGVTHIVQSTAEQEALVRSVRDNLEKVVSLGKVLSPDILMVLEDVTDPARLAELVAANLGLKVNEAQTILAILDPIESLRRVHSYLFREIEVYQMQVRIQSQAKDEIGRMQREHYLREQMRAIKTELGDDSSKEELENLWQKIEEVKLSEEAKTEVSRQLRRLERMHQDTSEATLTRTFIDTILALPWGQYSDDNLELHAVKETLDNDHYSLDQVKDRIIEYLAVKTLNPEAKSPIICFVGPPGVGKTSLGKSIAKAMNRKFSRISLGGVRDEADIRGHRKTYVGAYPGRVIQSLKNAGSCNPVIMLDEIDKMGADHRGDPAAALLEVLDPEQNKHFVDHYLGVPFDLSRVMFIANANTLDTVPVALRDRLEIIEVSGYSADEKLVIANQYLIPRQLKETGLDEHDVVFTKGAVQTIIESYTRESGLRGLEKQIASVCRKIVRQFAESKKEKTKLVLKISPHMVQNHLGASHYGDSFYYLEPATGVALGMAYTQFGGEILAIETNLVPSKNPKLVLTGQLGDVMKESAQTALSFLRSRADVFGFRPEALNENELHIHIPAGAIPKDGPSAGITIACSILSALLNTSPSKVITMTGEITLHGKVLPIGGLREKLLAAQREGIENIILPEKNRAIYDELNPNIRKKLNVKFVSNFIDIFPMVFDVTKIKSVDSLKVLPLTEEVSSRNLAS